MELKKKLDESNLILEDLLVEEESFQELKNKIKILKFFSKDKIKILIN